MVKYVLWNETILKKNGGWGNGEQVYQEKSSSLNNSKPAILEISVKIISQMEIVMEPPGQF